MNTPHRRGPDPEDNPRATTAPAVVCVVPAPTVWGPAVRGVLHGEVFSLHAVHQRKGGSSTGVAGFHSFVVGGPAKVAPSRTLFRIALPLRGVISRRGGFPSRAAAEREFAAMLEAPGPEALAAAWTVRRLPRHEVT